MKYLVFLFLLFSASVFANKIDSLQSDSDVYKFLVGIDSTYKGVNVNAYDYIMTILQKEE